MNSKRSLCQLNPTFSSTRTDPATYLACTAATNEGSASRADPIDSAAAVWPAWTSETRVPTVPTGK